MSYIIDANNVAGKLKMLREPNFDKQLTEMVRYYNRKRQKNIYLVFDGSEPWGDKNTINEHITVIYSPKDQYYQSADDKIVEMVRSISAGTFSWSGADSNGPSQRSDIVIITDDNELKRRLEEVQSHAGLAIKIERATDFAAELLRVWTKDEPEGTEEEYDDGSRGLGDNERSQIDNELQQLWQNK